MTIYYAQNDGRINDEGLWNTQRDGSGDCLRGPITDNDVLMANGHSILVDADTTCAKILSNEEYGATYGGCFTIERNVTVTVLGFCKLCGG